MVLRGVYRNCHSIHDHLQTFSEFSDDGFDPTNDGGGTGAILQEI